MTKPLPTSGPTRLTRRRRRNLGLGAGVLVVHMGLFALAGLTVDPPRITTPPPLILVDLVRLVPPPPPPAPPAPTSGGGAPAAPSRIHVPPRPVDPPPPELPAPVVQAPEPAVVVGVAPIATPTPGFGQGGEGTGTGTGIGSGDGPGSGSRTPPRRLRGPSQAQIVAAYPRAALAANERGNAILTCEIRLSSRLENCRVEQETPAGSGFGAAAMRVAPQFRFAPPTLNGRPIDRHELTIGVNFTPGGANGRR